MKNCIVSLAVGRQVYIKRLKRLKQSVQRAQFNGAFISWSETYPPGCPSQAETPFAFKPFCFMEAKKQGYDLILWIDSSGIVIRPLEPLLKHIRNEGFALFRNHSFILGEWCSDEVLQPLDITREEALELPEVKGAVIGLNMRNPIAVQFLDMWYEKAMDGISFKGTRNDSISYFDIRNNTDGMISKNPRIKGHRHDQTVAGVIASKLSIELLDEGFDEYRANFIPRIKQTTLITKGRHNVGEQENDAIMTLNQIYLVKYISYVSSFLDILRRYILNIARR